MTGEHLMWLVGAVLVIAFLYSSVGHAGASGYIAVMALLNVTPAVIKPTALVLNIAVAAIGAFQFWRAGHFRWPLFWPFAALSIPCALVGGYLNLPAHFFKLLLGVVLLFSASRFLVRPPEERPPRAPSRGVALATGATLGLLAGLTGTGGGIFLSPLMIWLRWGETKTVAAVSAMFILVNSIAGLAGNFGKTNALPAVTWPLLGAVIIGGTLGSYLSCHHFTATMIKRLLAVVLTIAGTKLLFAW